MSSKKSPKASEKKVRIGGATSSSPKGREERSKKTAAEYTIAEDYAMPDVITLGAKYDLHIAEKSEEKEEERDAELDSAMRDALIANIESSSGLVNQNQKLLDQITAKNREIENLRALIEACELPPGMSAEKLQRILVSGDDTCDYRDAKIVALAKKVRGLTVSLNKSRASLEASEGHIVELQRKSDSLQHELSAVLATHQRTGSTSGSGRGQRNTNNGLGSAEGSAKADHELRSMQKSNEDLRRKLAQSSDEVKNLTNALKKEVGDGVSLDQAVDEGWRGRAQQIIMLKNKIRRLESDQNTKRSTTNGQQSDVDTKAQEDIAGMMLDRKQAVEGIIEERARLQEQCQELEGKQRALRARIRTLESDSTRSKQQVQVLLDKNNTDDQLIDALRKEVANLKDQLQGAAMNQRAANENAKPVIRRLSTHLSGKDHKFHGGGVRTGSGITADDSGLDAEEMQRLRRLCRQQAEQLSTQDEVIKRLRSSLEKY
jgi:chromosome segregation ATPase